MWLGAWGIPARERAYYKSEKTKATAASSASRENYAAVNFMKMDGGRFFTEAEVAHRRNLAVLGQTPVKALFPNVDPVGKTIRVGNQQYEVIGYVGPRPNAGGLGSGQDDFIVVPYTTYQKQFGWRRSGQMHMNGTQTDASAMQSAMIAVVPREGATRDQMMADVEQVMRIRHGLKLDQANDFDIITQDAALKMWDQISGATFIGLVVISSIALMVGGIGVMAIMMISVTERTREIGVRKALGRPSTRDPVAVPAGGRLPHQRGRRARHHPRGGHRVWRPLPDGIPGVAAVVEFRPRVRLLGVGRRLLRPGASHPRRPPGSHRSAALRIAGTWAGPPSRHEPPPRPVHRHHRDERRMHMVFVWASHPASLGL